MQMEENRWGVAAQTAGHERWQPELAPANEAHLSMFCSTCQWQRLETVHTLVANIRTSHTRAVGPEPP